MLGSVLTFLMRMNSCTKFRAKLYKGSAFTRTGLRNDSDAKSSTLEVMVAENNSV